MAHGLNQETTQKGNLLRNNSWSEAPESEDEDENSLLTNPHQKSR